MTEIARSRIGVTTYLVPAGALTEAARIGELRDAIDASIAAREIHVVLDLAGVPLVNSVALEVLLDAQDHLSRLGGELKLSNSNATLDDVFRITGLSGHIASIEADSAEPATTSGRGPSPRGRRIGEILRDKGLVTQKNIEEGLELQRGSGQQLAQILVAKGWVDEKDLLQALGEQLGMPFVRLRGGLYDPASACLINGDVARRLRVMPLFQVRGVLYLATADPQSMPAIETVEDLSGLRAMPVLACSEEITRTIAEAHAEGSSLSEYISDLEADVEVVSDRAHDHAVIDEMAAGSPVINLINGIIQRAVRDGASDIHIEPSRGKCRIRLRVDGVLYTIMTPPADVHPALVSRLKVMSSLDIAERRLPQDGRMQVVTGGRVIDLRFSSMPGIFGEKVVLRVLDKNRAILDVDRLGMNERNRERYKHLLAKSYGLILVTGPTGSGKTTSLYAGLNFLNSSEKNILTIEDPVEYQIEGITQNQVREGIGLNFARVLKHTLRQDPDVIMVGEIRESETAEIAVQAALTGHLVLSTLHTSDAVGAVTRLLDMGIEPFLLSSALVGVIGQRLIRAVCSECQTSYVAPAATLAQYGVTDSKNIRLTRGRGCSSCYDSGYKGRLSIHEILEIDGELQRLIVASPGRDALDAWLRSHDSKRLIDDGIDRALEGRTTLEEVFRVVNS